MHITYCHDAGANFTAPYRAGLDVKPKLHYPFRRLPSDRNSWHWIIESTAYRQRDRAMLFGVLLRLRMSTTEDRARRQGQVQGHMCLVEWPNAGRTASVVMACWRAASTTDLLSPLFPRTWSILDHTHTGSYNLTIRAHPCVFSGRYFDPIIDINAYLPVLISSPYVNRSMLRYTVGEKTQSLWNFAYSVHQHRILILFACIFRFLYGKHRRRSSVNFEGARHFCPKTYAWKMTKCPNFTWYMPEKLTKCPNFTRFLPEKNSFCPNLGGEQLPPWPPVSSAYDGK